jgi:hypothetical protein
MNKQYYILPLLLLLSIFSISAVCEVYNYASGTSSTDYFGINTATSNTTTMSTDQLFGSYTFFTPRLNFTVVVNETSIGGLNQSNSQFSWKIWNTLCNDSLVIKNGTDTINRTNYTFIWINQTAGSWAVRWESSTYNGTTIAATCNRTFVKNVDDIIVSPGTIYSGATTAYFLSQSGGGSYGTSKTFTFNPSLLGGYINNTNWAVGWSYTNRTCISSLDSSTYTGINSTKTIIYAGLGLLAVLLLAMAAYGIIQIFNNGGDIMTLTITIIGGGVLLIVAFVIIYLVANALGG